MRKKKVNLGLLKLDRIARNRLKSGLGYIIEEGVDIKGIRYVNKRINHYVKIIHDVSNDYISIDKIFEDFGLDRIEIKSELKYYTYGFEYYDISKQKDKEKVYNDILHTFEIQLKDWIYG